MFNIFSASFGNLVPLSSSSFFLLFLGDPACLSKFKILHEFQDLFPTNFSEMKGIVGDLGEMKIPLRPDAKLVKQRPYRLNPRYKQKFKEKINRMLEVGVIKLVEES